MKCPHCGNEINVGALIGAEGGKARSRAKTRAARANAKLGGWPKGKKRGKRKPDANQIAHGVVAKAEKITQRSACKRCDGNGLLPFGRYGEGRRCPDCRGTGGVVTLQGPSPRRLKVLPSPKSPKRGH
jgi:DnaJ-class molecular chaperone